ncbi:hypothetical protein V496_09133 [Pseudogymnoascus sp. VKM F-4515 (FW-2607)]|nr:hypothetical protein V496_09133 [Pseudogymnoascus sp. VKM F-4515 (FW-2607)]
MPVSSPKSPSQQRAGCLRRHAGTELLIDTPVTAETVDEAVEPQGEAVGLVGRALIAGAEHTIPHNTTLRMCLAEPGLQNERKET